MLSSLIAIVVLIVAGIVEYEIEPIGELPKARSRRRLKFPKLPVLQVLLLIVEDIARHGEIIIKLDTNISPAVLAKDGIAVRVDVLRVLQAQLQHRGNRVLEAVGADEVPGLRDLLDGKECRVDPAAVRRLVLLLYERQENTLGLFQRESLLLLDDALEFIERVDGYDIPALGQDAADRV
jgi:hypothetical protein